jgi:hypothetical protein
MVAKTLVVQTYTYSYVRDGHWANIDCLYHYWVPISFLMIHYLLCLAHPCSNSKSSSPLIFFGTTDVILDGGSASYTDIRDHITLFPVVWLHAANIWWICSHVWWVMIDCQEMIELWLNVWDFEANHDVSSGVVLQNLEFYCWNMARAYDKLVKPWVFKKGDPVLALRQPIIVTKSKGKFDPKWEGPYAIASLQWWCLPIHWLGMSPANASYQWPVSLRNLFFKWHANKERYNPPLLNQLKCGNIAS